MYPFNLHHLMKKPILIAAVILLFGGAFAIFYSQRPIADPADYAAFMTPNHLENAKEKLQERTLFWENKLQAAPANFVYQSKLAGLYASWFKLTGDVQQLHRSDSLLCLVHEQMPNQVGTLQSMAANAITRHAFAEAEGYMRQALALGENRFASSLMLTDVLMERGNFGDADRLMRDMASRTHFDYLIREMKMLDQEGDLPSAIKNMEKALALARSAGSEELLNWSLSNLADMYGHDGRIRKSYNTYLEALRYNPADLHSLKGIAWVAFSQDKNTAEAQRILGFLQKIHPVPDYDLLLAEIAEFEGKDSESASLRQSFTQKASNPAYGNMYKSYLCELKATDVGQSTEALAIAQQEIKERPHPMSYSLLAWASLQNGEKAAAKEILEKYVVNRTEEPNALYRAGIILLRNGERESAKEYLESALEASYELGPVATAEIRQELSKL